MNRDSRYPNALTAAAMFSLVPMVFTMPVAALVTVVIPVMFLVTRNVLAVIPVVLYEIDPLAAGTVFMAVLAPMFGMARWHTQIDRRAI